MAINGHEAATCAAPYNECKRGPASLGKTAGLEVNLPCASAIGFAGGTRAKEPLGHLEDKSVQSLFTPFIVSVAFTLLLPRIADGQDRGQPGTHRADVSALEKRIEELEGKVTSVAKELEELRREVGTQSSVTVVPLRSVNVKEAVKAIRTIYRGHPGIEVTALANMRIVIIRADEKTKKDIIGLLRNLEELGQGKKEPQHEHDR